MNLTKALKQKKKLAKLAEGYWQKFAAENSHLQGTERNYSAEEMYNKWLETTNTLIDLKVKIQKANAPILQDIYRMAEIKGFIQRLRRVETRSGTFTVGYGNPPQTQEFEAFLNTVQVDKIVEAWEEEIEQLQEKIEAHNAITKI